MARMSRAGLLLITLFLFISTIRCSRYESKKQEEGGSHTGGGVVASSSIEEVDAAIDLAIKLASEPDPDKNVIVQFWKDWGQKSERSFIKNPSRIFPNLLPLDEGQNTADLPADQFLSPVLDALAMKTIQRLESGDCEQSDKKKHADASVSSFDLNADLCVSKGNLTKLTPSVILKETLGLLLHEACHMGGCEEIEAEAWQDEFTKYFADRFGDITVDSITTPTLKMLAEARLIIKNAIGASNQYDYNPRMNTYMGQLMTLMLQLPYLLDPVAIELIAKPEHPELILNYSYSVTSMVSEVQFYFEILPIHIEANEGRPFTIHLVPSHQILKDKLQELEGQLDTILENFLVALDGTTAATIQSTCTTPRAVVDPNLFARPNVTIRNFPLPNTSRSCNQPVRF